MTTIGSSARLGELADAPASVKAWLDRTHYAMGLDDLDWVRGWVERTARDLKAAAAEEATA
jgi:hypothetical protein